MHINTFNPKDHDIHVRQVYRNLPPSSLYEHAIRYDKGASIAENLPSDILIPRNAWADKSAYEATANKLAGLFRQNFQTYQGGVNAEVKAAGPS